MGAGAQAPEAQSQVSRAPDTQLPDWLTSRAYRCDVCGDDAGQVVLQFFRGYDDVTVVVDGLIGQMTTWLSPPKIAPVETALAGGTPLALYELDREWASFYCPDCKKSYCRKHWDTEVVYDDDPEMRGWYDCTYGTCPAGHRRMVDD